MSVRDVREKAVARLRELGSLWRDSRKLPSNFYVISLRQNVHSPLYSMMFSEASDKCDLSLANLWMLRHPYHYKIAVERPNHIYDILS